MNTAVGTVTEEYFQTILNARLGEIENEVLGRAGSFRDQIENSDGAIDICKLDYMIEDMLNIIDKLLKRTCEHVHNCIRRTRKV